jgi:bacteriocin-like protein
MSELNNDDRELTIEELEAVSGGRIKIEKPPGEIAREIAQLQADNPGFV